MKLNPSLDFLNQGVHFHYAGGFMRVADEFRIKNASGHEVILQKVVPGISYLDFGSSHLPRDFQGYRVKHTDKTAESLSDDAFKIEDTDQVYKRL